MFDVTFADPHVPFSHEDRRIANKICADSAMELRVLLPALPDVVHVQIGNHGRVIPQFGYGARATTMNSVSFVLNPDHAKASALLMQEHLRPALFHECHHLVRGWVLRGGRRPRRFIDGVIHEGLASAFERDAAGQASPWTSYPSEVGSWVNELLALPVNAPYADWMFFHPDGRRWIGYRAGVFIADCAIAASGLTAAELVHSSSEEILALANIPLSPMLQ